MNHNVNILLVEDDPYILKLCSLYLKDAGYQTQQATSGKDALTLFYQQPADIVLLDLGLPDMDGLELIALLRRQRAVPIIVVSARNEEAEKIRALDLGADDYMTKPFHTGELLARIRVAQRRLSLTAGTAGSDVFVCGALQVDHARQQVRVNGQEVHLTPIEYKLLRLLIQNRGKVLTHHYIQQQIWGSESATDAQNLRVFMANLRRKIEPRDALHHYIQTQVGIGYRFTDQDAEPGA